MRLPVLFAIVALALAGIAFTAPGSARPHVTPSPSPTPIEDPAITKLARAQFVDWQAGVVNQHLYAPQVLEKLTDAKISDTSKALAGLGALDSTIYIGPWIDATFPPGAHGYIYQMKCASGDIYLWLALDAQGKIATIFFKNRLDAETVTPSPRPS